MRIVRNTLKVLLFLISLVSVKICRQRPRTDPNLLASFVTHSFLKSLFGTKNVRRRVRSFIWITFVTCEIWSKRCYSVNCLNKRLNDTPLLQTWYQIQLYEYVSPNKNTRYQPILGKPFFCFNFLYDTFILTYPIDILNNPNESCWAKIN